MSYQVKILIASFVVAIATSMIIIPLLRKQKVEQIEREEGPQSHLKKQGTPTMGGIVMIISIIMVTSFSCFVIFPKQAQIVHNLLPLVIVSIGFGMIGLIDDFKKLILKNTEGLKPSYKMIGLLVIAVTFVIYLLQFAKIGTQTYLPIIKQVVSLPLILYIPFVIFVMLGTTNAINLTDGIDGLATSITTIIMACLTIVGILYDIKEVVIFGSMVCGVNLGFLVFNMYPAKVFMGDTGSLFLGGAMAAMVLYLKMPLLLIVIALIPIIETVSVMLQVVYFKKTGKRIFKMTPIHHHFELSGWNENKIVSIFSMVTFVLCWIGLQII